MKILSITAQKPNSTGSGVYLTGLVNGFAGVLAEQAVVAGVEPGECAEFPEGTKFFPVYYRTEELPFPVLGMSDEMPYESTKYRDMDEQMTEQFMKAFLKKIKEAAEYLKPDLILCHHLYYLTALVRDAFPECKVAGICHGTGLRQMKKISYMREYIREHIQKLDQIFALQEDQKREISKVYGVSKEKIQVIGTGYNSAVFYPPEEEKGLGSGEKKVLIFAGKLSEKKGVMSLLRSLDYTGLPKASLKVVLAGGAGSREEYEVIRRLVKACPYEVVETGRLPQEQLAQEFRKADVFVLPSFYEGLPLVILEAMACGLKVVSTRLPGICEWLDACIPDNGIRYVLPPAFQNADEPDEAELPAFEKRLGETLRAAIDETGRKTDVSGLSWEAVCSRIIKA